MRAHTLTRTRAHAHTHELVEGDGRGGRRAGRGPLGEDRLRLETLGVALTLGGAASWEGVVQAAHRRKLLENKQTRLCFKKPKKL